MGVAIARRRAMSIRRIVGVATVIGVVASARAVLRRRRAFTLDRRVVVIMGGSRGLGLELARVFVDRGARVALCARDVDELSRACDQLGDGVFAVPCDVADMDSVHLALASVTDELGDIDVLVNCAGIIQVGPIEKMTREDFDVALRTNLWGPLHAMLAVIPEMRRRKQGRIVNIASIAGKVAVPHLAPYSTSKFGLVGLSETMRVELAKDNIFVTTVCPGLMRTGSPRHAWFKGSQQAEYAWFSILDSLPITSMSAEAAATQIVRACENGDAELVVSWQAKLATIVHGIAPNLMQEILSLVTRVLPGPTSSHHAVQGKDVESVLAPSALTRNSDEAARRNNELD